MFTNLLKWAFKYGEEEAHLLIGHTASLDMCEDIAHKIITHCAMVREQQKAKAAADAEAAKAAEAPKSEDSQLSQVVD